MVARQLLAYSVGRTLPAATRPYSSRILQTPHFYDHSRVLSPYLQACRTLATESDPPPKPLNEHDHVEGSSPDRPPDKTEQPDETTGFLYFDSTFPIKLGWWDIRAYIAATPLVENTLLQRIKDSIPPAKEVGHGFKMLGVEERIKDGGAFVSFRYERSILENRDVALLDIERSLKKHIGSVSNPYMLSFWRPSVHVVRGKPWREDMNRFPSSRVRVKFEGSPPDVEEERLWDILRPYGRIVNIDKSKAGEAIVSFSRMRGATSARNCTHGLVLPSGTRLVLNYERALRSHQIWEWLTTHPRIVFPLVLALLSGFTYAVFDPIRAFFVESKLDNTFNLQEYRIYRWLREKTAALFIDEKSPPAQEDWVERKQAAENIEGWLRETPSTFITITGPRGSGKGGLLHHAITKDMKHLNIDCDNIAANAKGEAGLVPALASEIGYWPVFSFLNSINNLIDLAAVGLIGSKAGFATPADAQLRQVLSVATDALANTHHKEKERRKKELEKSKKGEKAAAEQREVAAEKGGMTADAAPGAQIDKAMPTVGTVPGLGAEHESEKLSDVLPNSSKKAESSRKASRNEPSLDELGVEQNLAMEASASSESSGAPVVVINAFASKSLKSQALWSALAEWGAELVSHGIAHVIIVSSNPVATQKELSRALPNVPFESIVLADADTERAREYVANKLAGMGKLEEAQRAMSDEERESVRYDLETPKKNTSNSAFSPSALLAKSAAVFSSSNSETESQPPQPAAQIPSPPEGAQEDGPPPVLNASTTKWVDMLGGRLTDLENLVQKVSLGQSIHGAVEDIIARTTVELRKNAFGDDQEDAKALPWSRGQAWALISALAKEGELNYHGLLYGAFNSDEAALKALEQAELIAVRHVNGRPSGVRAGRPVFQKAIERLVEDKVFADTHTLLDAKAAVDKSEGLIRAYERELQDLAALGDAAVARNDGAPRMRAIHLLGKMREEQVKVDKGEKKVEELKKKLLVEKDLGRVVA